MPFLNCFSFHQYKNLFDYYMQRVIGTQTERNEKYFPFDLKYDAAK